MKDVGVSMKFDGVMTAIVSPMIDSKLDKESYLALIKQQYEGGVRKLVINGTTGESPSLEWNEVEDLVKWTRESDYQFDIVVGAGGNATAKVISLAKKAEAIGADAILSVVPYYNKPTQEGLYQHFQSIASSIKIPVILYNVPGRTITSLEVNTIKRLSEIENIVAIKEATGDVSLIKDILKEAPKLKVLSGDDGTYLASALEGCHGVISVISHIIPDKFVNWTKRAHEGDRDVLTEYAAYNDLCDLLFSEPNPVPVKTCLKEMGVISSDSVRLPLVECSKSLTKTMNAERNKLEI